MWNFAKSAEAILSQFILKRLCKFLLKRKLGQFILGDIDLDQLDVQIAAGTLQLSDLALNVDFINQKLGQTTILRVQEGSIRSLLVKMPWTGRGCEVELDEVEIVLSPCCNEKLYRASGNHDTNEDYHKDQALGKDEQHLVYKTSAASASVHEGVKTVAKMVKWLLTSFHIRIKNVIVAFDPGVEKDKDKGSHQTLVLRITDLECGTCISEDNNSPDTKAADFLGISHLTNFLRFEGVSLELLVPTRATASGSHFPSTSKPLLTGERGGFSGNLKLSIPWKNGSLDIRKVDAEVTVAPLSAKLQPSTVKWILNTWEMLEEQKNDNDTLYHKAADTVFSSLTSHCHSHALPSSMLTDERLVQGKERSIDFSVPFSEAGMNDVLLEESHLISDWMPSFVGKYKIEGIEVADLGASVDQFFECFDGMRSSQSVLGSSGVWGWTSSVFSAITAASSLASGSSNISTEQQHVQTNLKINLAGLLMTFSFFDEDQLGHGPSNKQIDTAANIHHLDLRCEDIVISVQVYLQEWKLEAVVKHTVLDDYLSQEEPARDFDVHKHEKEVSNQISMFQDMQDKVQSALPSSSLFPGALNPNVSDASSNTETFSNLVKATVFETYGAIMFAVSSKSFDGHSAGQASFSLKLPPFIFWVNLDLVKAVLGFSGKFENYSGKNSEGTSLSTKTFEGKHDSSAHCDVIRSQPHAVTSTPRKGSLHGSVYLPHARIILCFPSKSGGGFKSYTSCDQFIALDFSSPPNFRKLKDKGSALLQDNRSLKRDCPSSSCSVHLNVATMDIYNITRDVGDDSGSSPELSSQGFCGHKILSLQNGSDWVCLISMLWHENAVTGAWIIESAKLLAKSDEPAGKRSSTTSRYEFASVFTKKDMEDMSAQKRREMILSSKFCLHVCLPVTVITLSSSQYLRFFHLLSEFMDVLSADGSDTSCDDRRGAFNQTSIFLECSSIKIQIELDQGDCLTSSSSSLQRELPGSWKKLKLEIQKFYLLSVSDIGAVNGASFLWISHSEGKLWGSICTLGDQDLLLMSCTNSSSGRGNGEGSNVLYCRPAGSDFVHVCDPRVLHNSMSIAVKCGTIVAPGGRLDWLDKLLSFFSLPSAEIGEEANCNSQKGDSPRASLVVKFIDTALSYEPYSGNLEGLMSKAGCSVSFHGDPCDPYVSCLLAVSVLTLSDTRIAESSDNEYGIRLQDVGLLLHALSRHGNALVDHSVDHLHKLGYVKVAGEALVDACLKIKCESDLSWELSCSESHIVLSTCHDTTFGLIRLASQIQQLFAPDIEESIVHLQNRWNSLKQAHGKDEPEGNVEATNDSSLLASHMQELSPDSKGKPGLFNLMDEICEDAFKFGGKGTSTYDGSEVSISVDGILHDEGPSSTVSCSGNFLEGCDVPNVQKAELIEGYCLSDLRSLSELTINSPLISKLKLTSTGNGDFQRGSSGWYGRTSLRVVEDYVSVEAVHSSSMQLVDLHQSNKEGDGSKRYKGRLLLKNIGVKWRMYAGSDWHELGKTVQHSGHISGRDRTVCLELALSNMNIQYDVLPDGGIYVSKLCLSVQDIFLYDKSKFAPWKLVLGYYHSKERPRESSSKALKLNLEAVRPDSMTPLEEYRLHVAFLPLLLHLHQSQLDFLVAFFGAKHSPDEQSRRKPQNTCSSDVISGNDNSSEGVSIADEALLPFFQKFDIWPIVVRVDYRPSRVDLAALSGGKYVELVNLVPWKGVELQLKHVQAAGVYGWSNVLETAFGEWLEDISQNQIHKLLQGLPPIRSLVAVSSGAAKLVSLPVRNYRKDDRLVKGLQRGTVAFLRSISVEALGLGLHLAAGAHEILFHAESILTRIQPSVPRPIRTVRSDRPEDAQRGLQQAYESLSDGIGKSASALIRSPLKVYQRGSGVGSAFVTAVRGAPAAAIAPASAAAQALHYALLGVRNSLDPEHKEESKNKYSGPSDSSDHS